MAVNLNLKINQFDRLIDPQHIPQPSKKSEEIFHEFAPFPNEANKNLLDRCKTLKSTINELQNAKEHPIRTKLFAFLATTLTIGVAVGSVLGGIAAVSAGLSTGVGSAIMITGLLIYGVLSMLLSEGKIPSDLWGAVLVFGPFMPLVEAFTKISTLTKETTELKNSLEEDLSKLTLYFDENYKQIKEAIQEKIEALSENLEKVEGFEEKFPQGESILKNSIEDLNKALKDLETAHEFYQQFIEG